VERDLVVMADDSRRGFRGDGRRRGRGEFRDFSDLGIVLGDGGDLGIVLGDGGQSCRLGCEAEVEMAFGSWSVFFSLFTGVAGAELGQGDNSPVLARKGGSSSSSSSSS